MWEGRQVFRRVCSMLATIHSQHRPGSAAKKLPSASFSRRLRFEPLEERRLLTVMGDYNGNFVADAADYVVWRKTEGLTGDQPADGNADLVVDNLDYDIWSENFGNGLLPGPFNITTPAIFGEDDFTITWEPSANATSYELILSYVPTLDPDFYVGPPLTTTSRTFTDFGNGTVYMGVVAQNAAGSTPATNNGLVFLVDDFVAQTIFVTANTFSISIMPGDPHPLPGAFHGASEADYQVTQNAYAAGLIDSWNGTDIVFQALLTVELVDLPTRAGLGDVDFVNVNGDIVAHDRAELYSGAHLAPILTQNGAQVPSGTVPVWTGSTANGEWSGLTAQDWTSRFSTATVGNANGTGTTWLSNTTRASNLGARFYAVGVRSTPYPNVPPPTITTQIPDQIIAVGAPFSIDVANNFDNEHTYYFRQASGLPLPSWLTNDYETSVLTGTPTAADVGTITVEVTARERRNFLTVIDTFDLTVTSAGSGALIGHAISEISSAALTPGFRQAEPDPRTVAIHPLAPVHKTAGSGKRPSLALPQWESGSHDAALMAWLSSRIRNHAETAEDKFDRDDRHARVSDIQLMDEALEDFNATLRVGMKDEAARVR